MSKSDLKAYLNNSSLRHALWRNMELEILESLEYSDPILDIACGDGYFGNKLFKKNKVIGFDISLRDLNEAKKREKYSKIFAGDACNIPLGDKTFRTVFSNSVFEHIPEVDLALSEVSRVLVDGGKGRFIFSVPNNKFSEYLLFGQFFKKIGFLRLSEIYKNKTNEFLKHKNMDSLDVWRERLNRVGLKIEKVIYYLPKSSVHLWDILFLPAYISDCFYKILKKRMKLPFRISIGILLNNIMHNTSQGDNQNGAAMIILAIKE